MAERPMGTKATAANTVPDKKAEKVVKGTVKKKRKSEVTKFKDTFISEDINSVKSYILLDVLVPSIKKALSDIVKDGIDMILYGDKQGSRNNSSHVPYRNYSSNSRPSNHATRTNYDFADLVFDTRSEAENVLSNMDELMDRYGAVAVADMYDLAGVTCNYTDYKYGWTNISSAQVVHGRDGYIIKMPRVVPV